MATMYRVRREPLAQGEPVEYWSPRRSGGSGRFWCHVEREAKRLTRGEAATVAAGYNATHGRTEGAAGWASVEPV